MLAEDHYRLLTSPSEKGRQYFMTQHPQKLIPNLEKTEKVKHKILMNDTLAMKYPQTFESF